MHVAAGSVTRLTNCVTGAKVYQRQIVRLPSYVQFAPRLLQFVAFPRCGKLAAMKSSTIPNVLTIAGVDPSGGAGIVADIKAISAQRAYACAVVAALTAQNTQAVTGVLAVDPAFVARADRYAVMPTSESIR